MSSLSNFVFPAFRRGEGRGGGVKKGQTTKEGTVPAPAALPFARHKNSAGYGKQTIHPRRGQVQHTKLFPAPPHRLVILRAKRYNRGCKVRLEAVVYGGVISVDRGRGVCATPLLLALFLCLNPYYSGCSAKKQPTILGNSKEFCEKEHFRCYIGMKPER